MKNDPFIDTIALLAYTCHLNSFCLVGPALIADAGGQRSGLVRKYGDVFPQGSAGFMPASVGIKPTLPVEGNRSQDSRMTVLAMRDEASERKAAFVVAAARWGER
jgi:hypothetical protein